MISIIKDVKVYSPNNLGKNDVVIVGEKFEGIYKNIVTPKDFIHINEIEGRGKIMLPGFIDGHVHIVGGGGEGGFNSRTPEIKFTELTTSGITTVVGCIGTDSICRDMRTLVAKAKALEEEGITSYCYTGSYDVPVKTMTESIKADIMLIDKIIGVGEIALSDNRSSQPTYNQFVNLVAQARVGGLLSGKAGVVNVHLGAGKRKLEYLFSLIEGTEIPATQILPTHINRSTELFEEGIKYIKMGGFIDLTTSTDPNYLEPTEMTARKCLSRIIEEGLPIERVTFSSDGNGSMPKFNEKKELEGLGICSVKTLYEEVRKAILEDGIPIEIAMKVITSNVARLLKLMDRGEIKEGNIADFVLVDENDLSIVDVYGRGKPLVKNKKPIVLGTFA